MQHEISVTHQSNVIGLMDYALVYKMVHQPLWFRIS